MSKNSIFVSHSSKEISFVDSLLLQEKKTNNYKLWAASNENIGLGKEFRHKITKAINDSSGAIILISNNLLSSEFVMEYELPLLIEKSKNYEDYFIIPILIEKCSWSENELLKELQLINSENTPLKELKGKQYTVLIQEVSRYITDYLNEIEERIKRNKQFKRKSSLRIGLFSLILLALISIFNLIYDNNSFQSSPEQIRIDIESLTEQEKEELVNQLINDELERQEQSPEIIEESLETNQLLRLVVPDSCSSSNENVELASRNPTSCFNLTDWGPPVGWVGSEFCIDQWISFEWEEPLYIEFVTFENFEDDQDFNKYSSIKEFTFITPANETLSGSLERQNSSSQWFDINLLTSLLKLEIDSYDEGEVMACGLQNVTFYGRNP